MDKEDFDRLEKRLAKIEDDTRIGLEDQLFFGLVISITVFAITLSVSELTSLLQSVVNWSYDVALKVSQGSKIISVGALIFACVSRYYGAVKPHKGARLVSFLSLVGSVNFVVMLFVANIYTIFPMEIQPPVYAVSLLALVIIYVALGKFFEGKIIKFYAEKRLITKKYEKLAQFPPVSYLFMVIVAGFCLALLVQYLSLFFLGVRIVAPYDTVLFFLFYFSFAAFYLWRYKRAKMLF